MTISQSMLGLFQFKKAITVRNAIAEVFIQGYPETLQSDNRREFINKILNAYLVRINIRHILGSPYHPQSQGAIEAFNKTVQKSLSTACDNAKQENLEWDFELNIFLFFISIIASVYTQQPSRFHDMY